jgi:hypothetical protein
MKLKKLNQTSYVNLARRTENKKITKWKVILLLKYMAADGGEKLRTN